MSQIATTAGDRQTLDSHQNTPEHARTRADEPYTDTVATAATWSSLSQIEIRRLIADGKLDARRHGRRILILRSSLREYLDTLPRV